MAASHFKTAMYPAENFVESAGTVLFRHSTHEICILRMINTGEYVLPKGRRNVGESRRVTATRETTEETGVPCRLLPVNLACRLCPAVEIDQMPDEVRSFEGICEPIMMQIRQYSEDNVKLIWWFVAVVNEGEPIGQHEDQKFEVEFHGREVALEKLTFKDDREVVEKAIELVNSTVDTH